VCHKCHKKGHIKKNCHKSKNVSSMYFDHCYVLTHNTKGVHAKFVGTYPPLQFIVTIHRYYSSSLLFIIVSIHHRYYPSMISMVPFCCHYSLLLFIDHPITPHFNYSSIMLSSKSKTSQTHISVIRTPVTMIFLPMGTSHLVTHPRFLQVEHA
jgi:hypothetical protein